MKALWEDKAVGEILQLEYGKPLRDADRKPDGLYPVYGANGEKDRSDKFYIDRPSIIVGRKGSAGEVNLTEQKFWPLDVTYFVTFNEQQHDLRFLYYLLKMLDLPSLARGVKPGINRNEVYSQVVKISSLAEQQRIVGVLDDAFEGIATAKANAEKNFKNAHALFESCFQSAFAAKNEEWLHCTIGDQITLQRGFDITKDQQNQGKIPVVSSGGIKSFHDKAMVQGPGVVIGRKGTLGKVFYVGEDFWPHDTTLWVKDFKGNDPRFVYYFFTGLDVKKLDSGAANPALNRNQVHPIAIDWPPVTRQKAIVLTLDALQQEIEHVELLYQRKHAALEALTKSLLHQAFAGDL